MNTRIANGFDFLAPFYDVLARLIIGKSIVISQLYFLKRFKQSKHLLILGGGSGWLLDSLCKECPDVRIDYIDVSPGMINRAKERVKNNHRINFIQGGDDDIPDRLYDGVITNFYLDMFDEKGLDAVIEKIKKALTKSSLWVVTDFVSEQRGHELMLWWMYRFFRIIARIEATSLPDWQSHMKVAGSELLESKKFKNGFIAANLYSVKDLVNQ
jgi:ubiquinone/menaquinone biosynthesis C-methylase UbiE